MNGGLLQLDIPDDWVFSDVEGSVGVVTEWSGTAGGNVLSFPARQAIRYRSNSVQLWRRYCWSSQLTITLTNIIVPIPDRLTDGTEADPYEQYEFTASSRSRVGRLDTLNPTTAEPEPQAFVRVGNIASGTGTVTVSPDEIYETYPNPRTRNPVRLQLNLKPQVRCGIVA